VILENPYTRKDASAPFYVPNVMQFKLRPIIGDYDAGHKGPSSIAICLREQATRLAIWLAIIVAINEFGGLGAAREPRVRTT
jgi:hypothetical protein